MLPLSQTRRKLRQGTFVEEKQPLRETGQTNTFHATRIMNTNPALPTRVTTVFALVLAAVVVSNCGCGGSSETTTEPNASALLERIEEDRRRHDPLHFSEVDLGQFTVTQRHEPSIFYIRFHLYGVVPDGNMEKFNELLQTHTERLRAKVREAVQKCDVDHLNDPSLGWLKSELIASINHIVQAPMLRDVVFADFSFERG